MDALSTADKKRIERSLTKISNTLISKAEGYSGSNHLLHDLREDYELDGRQLAIQCGFASFEEFMASDTMKKYVRVEGQGANIIYKPAYDPCMQHIVDEMLKSRSDVLRRNELKESREAARNSNTNGYTNNSAANPFSQDSLNSKNNYTSLTGKNQANNFNQHPPVARQQQRQQQQPWPKSAPRPLMSIVVPPASREDEMYRSTQRNNFTAVLPNGINATENSASISGQAAYLPNRQVGNNQSYHPVEPVARTAAAEDSVQKPVRNVFDIGSSGQQKVNSGMIAERNHKCSSVSNGFVVCNSPTYQSAISPLPSSPASASSASKKQTLISINWNLDEEDDDEQRQISARKSSSSDEWDFGDLEISNPAVKPAPVISPKIVASSAHPTNGFFDTNYNRRNHNQTDVTQPTTSQSKAPTAKPSLPGVQPRKTPQPEPAPARRKFQRAPDTSPPTNYSPSTATARVSLATVKDPILWLGDLEKQKIEEEKTQRLRMETAKPGSSNNQPFNASAAVQRNREVRNGALPARFIANGLRSTPFFSGTGEGARKNAQTRLPTRSSHVNTSYNGTGYRTKEEYDNRLELSDSD